MLCVGAADDRWLRCFRCSERGNNITKSTSRACLPPRVPPFFFFPPLLPLTRFLVGQVSMFFPTPEGNFLAFNVGCPGHFLSKESQELVGEDEHFRAYYVLGRIIEIQVTEPPRRKRREGWREEAARAIFFFRGAI